MTTVHEVGFTAVQDALTDDQLEAICRRLAAEAAGTYGKPVKPESFSKKMAYVGGVVGLFLLVVGPAWPVLSPYLASEPSRNEQTAWEQKLSACGYNWQDVQWEGERAAKDSVSATLRAPSTTQFSDVGFRLLDGCKLVVAGNVDAQNGFGAMLRGRWNVILVKANGKYVGFDPEVDE